MTRSDVIRRATRCVTRGDFAHTVARRLALATESQKPDNHAALRAYLSDELRPVLETMGFVCHFLTTEAAPEMPFMLAERIEDPVLPTLLSYEHGDVVFGDVANWREGLDPWPLIEEQDRWGFVE